MRMVVHHSGGSGIVSRTTSSARWADRATASLFSATFVAMTTVLFASIVPLSTGLLSFFSVDQIQRTDFNEGRMRAGLATASSMISPVSDYAVSSSGEKTIDRGSENFLQGKTFGNSGQTQLKGKHNRRERGDGGCSNVEPGKKCGLDRKQKRRLETVQQELNTQKDLTWDSVTILDEHDLEEEVETGKTRIHFLPEGRQVSSFLNRGMNGRFLFLISGESRSISMVIVPCNSVLVGTINFMPATNTGNLSKLYVAFKRTILLDRFRTQRTVSYEGDTAMGRGIYLLELRPVYSNTYVHIFVTTDRAYSDPFNVFNAPPTNSSLEGGRLHMYNFLNVHNTHPIPWVGVKRLRGSRIQVKWDPSPFNPHRMNYCIVFNTKKDYTSLCGAQGDKYGFLPPDLTHLPIYPFYPEVRQGPSQTEADTSVRQESGVNQVSGVTTKNEGNGHGRGMDHDIVVGCLKRKTNYILSDLKEGTLYYFNVFAKDLATGLSYPYVRTVVKQQNPKRNDNLLRDAKPVKVPIGPNSVTLEFRVKKPCSELSIYIMPCGGGSISYQILTANRTICEATNVESFDIIKMAFPIRASYFIKIGQPNPFPEDQPKARMVEVFVSKKQKKFPLPKLPVITTINELVNERGCDTVTLQWHPSPDFRDNEYCFFLKEERRRKGDYLNFKKPNQCDIERSLHSDPYVSRSYCIQKLKTEERNVFTERVGGLKPATLYIVQMIVKRHNGVAALSYDLLHVLTKPNCLD